MLHKLLLHTTQVSFVHAQRTDKIYSITPVVRLISSLQEIEQEYQRRNSETAFIASERKGNASEAASATTRAYPTSLTQDDLLLVQ